MDTNLKKLGLSLFELRQALGLASPSHGYTIAEKDPEVVTAPGVYFPAEKGEVIPISTMRRGGAVNPTLNPNNRDLGSYAPTPLIPRQGGRVVEKVKRGTMLQGMLDEANIEEPISNISLETVRGPYEKGENIPGGGGVAREWTGPTPWKKNIPVTSGQEGGNVNPSLSDFVPKVNENPVTKTGMPTPTTQYNREDWPLRVDGTKKGLGYFGVLPMTDGSGRVASEYTIGVNFDGTDMIIPSMVPTLSKEELNYILGGGKLIDKSEMGNNIIKKAVEHAKSRKAKGLSPFAQEDEEGLSTITTEVEPTLPLISRQFGGNVDPRLFKETFSVGGMEPTQQGIEATANTASIQPTPINIAPSSTPKPIGNQLQGPTSFISPSSLGSTPGVNMENFKSLISMMTGRDSGVNPNVPKETPMAEYSRTGRIPAGMSTISKPKTSARLAQNQSFAPPPAFKAKRSSPMFESDQRAAYEAKWKPYQDFYKSLQEGPTSTLPPEGSLASFMPPPPIFKESKKSQIFRADQEAAFNKRWKPYQDFYSSLQEGGTPLFSRKRGGVVSPDDEGLTEEEKRARLLRQSGQSTGFPKPSGAPTGIKDIESGIQFTQEQVNQLFNDVTTASQPAVEPGVKALDSYTPPAKTEPSPMQTRTVEEALKSVQKPTIAEAVKKEEPVPMAPITSLTEASPLESNWGIKKEILPSGKTKYTLPRTEGTATVESRADYLKRVGEGEGEKRATQEVFDRWAAERASTPEGMELEARKKWATPGYAEERLAEARKVSPLTISPYTKRVSGAIGVSPGYEKSYYEAHPEELAEERRIEMAERANKPMIDAYMKLMEEAERRAGGFGSMGLSRRGQREARVAAAASIPQLAQGLEKLRAIPETRARTPHYVGTIQKGMFGNFDVSSGMFTPIRRATPKDIESIITGKPEEPQAPYKTGQRQKFTGKDGEEYEGTYLGSDINNEPKWGNVVRIAEKPSAEKVGQNWILPDGPSVISYDGGRTYIAPDGQAKPMPPTAVKVPGGATLDEIRIEKAKEQARSELGGIQDPSKPSPTEAALTGTGPYKKMASAFEAVAGGFGLDLLIGKRGLFPDMADAKQYLRGVKQMGKAALMNSSRGAIWEQQKIEELFPNPDTLFTNPRIEAQKFGNLLNMLAIERYFNNQAILNAFTPKEIEKYRNSNNEIDRLISFISEPKRSKGLTDEEKTLIEKYRKKQ